MTDLDTLEAAAKAAYSEWENADIMVGCNPNVADRLTQFISLVNPATLLAMIEELREFRAMSKIIESHESIQNLRKQLSRPMKTYTKEEAAFNSACEEAFGIPKEPE